MTYLDAIDLHAQTALGRIHDALRKARIAHLSGSDAVHNEVVKILKEAYEAGRNEAGG